MDNYLPRPHTTQTLNDFHERLDAIEKLVKPNLLILSTPPGCGKTTSLLQWVSESPETRFYIVIQDLSSIAQKEVSQATSTLLSLMKQLAEAKLLEWPPPLTKQAKTQPVNRLDPITLFRRYVCTALHTITKPIVLVIDSPERNDDEVDRNAMYHILFSMWKQDTPGHVGLVISTSLPHTSAPISTQTPVQTTIMTRLTMSSTVDEVVLSYFVASVDAEDVEWEMKELEQLAARCGNCVLMAKLILIIKKRLDTKSKRVPMRNLPGTLDDAFEFMLNGSILPASSTNDMTDTLLWLVAREAIPCGHDVLYLKPLSRDDTDVITLLRNSDAFMDWFSSTYSRQKRQQTHGKLGKLLFEAFDKHEFCATNAAFHLIQAGDLETARLCFVQWERVEAMVLKLDQAIRDGDVYLERRPLDLTVRIIVGTLRLCLSTVSAQATLLEKRDALAFQVCGRLTGSGLEDKADFEIGVLLDAARKKLVAKKSWKLARASLPIWPETLVRVYRGHGDTVLCVSALQDPRSGATKFVAAGSYDGTIRLFDFATARCRATLESIDKPFGYVACVALNVHEDVVIVLSGTADGIARLWFIRGGGWQVQGPQLLQGHTDSVTGCAFSNVSCEFAVTCSQDGYVRAWSLPLPNSTTVHKQVTCTHVIGSSDNGPAYCISFVGNMHVVSGFRDGTLRLYTLSRDDFTEMSLVNTIPGAHLTNITSVSSCGEQGDEKDLTFATGGWDCFARVWKSCQNDDGDDGDDVTKSSSSWDEVSLFQHTDWVWGVRMLSPKYLACGSDDGIIRVFSVASSKCLVALDAHSRQGIYAVTSVPGDPSKIFSGSIDSTTRLFDVSRVIQKDSNREKVPGPMVQSRVGHRGRVRCACFGVGISSWFVFTGGVDRKPLAWDVQTGLGLWTGPELKGEIVSMLVAPTGTQIEVIDELANRIVLDAVTGLQIPNSIGARFLKCLEVMCEDPWKINGRQIAQGDGNSVLYMSIEEDGSKVQHRCTFDLPIDAWANTEGSVAVVAEESGAVSLLVR